MPAFFWFQRDGLVKVNSTCETDQEKPKELSNSVFLDVSQVSLEVCFVGEKLHVAKVQYLVY